MLLKDFLSICESFSEDTTDTTWDILIHLEYEKLHDDKQKMYESERIIYVLMDKLQLVEYFDGAYCNFKIDYNGFVEKNKAKLLRFLNHNKYYDFDINGVDYEANYNILEVLNYAMAGSYAEAFCSDLIEVLKTCK